jgi:hypothetical protein
MGSQTYKRFKLFAEQAQERLEAQKIRYESEAKQKIFIFTNNVTTAAKKNCITKQPMCCKELYL